MSKPYVEIADRIAARIARGEIALGAQLPPQRSFAYQEGIAVSTASRVYEELGRRGLVTGEVGRGTYVTNRFTPLAPFQGEPGDASLDLDIVFRLGASARDEIGASTQRFFRNGLSAEAAAPASVRGSAAARAAFAGMIADAVGTADPESILITGNGKQAIAAALATLAPRGGRVAVEALTYPFVIASARLLGIDLVPLTLDAEGVVPEALDRAARGGLQGLYLQPTLQNPLVLTMSDTRRRQIAEILLRHDLMAVEDGVYGFLRPTTPIAAHAPEHVIGLDSLSKRLMPGLTVGLLTAPPRLRERLAWSIRSGGWMAPALAVALARHWIDDGALASVQAIKRKEAAAMHDIACAALGDLAFHAAPDGLHGWIPLTGAWRGDSFAEASARLGIAVAPGRTFAVRPGEAPSGVRIAFSAPDLDSWRFALEELGQLLRQGPDR